MKRADHLLRQWGNWSRKGGRHTGYPSRSVIGRIMDEGPGASQPTGDIPMPNLVKLTEEIVLQLPRELQIAVELKYVDRMSDKRACMNMACGHSMYRQKLWSGIAFVEGYLTAIGVQIYE